MLFKWGSFLSPWTQTIGSLSRFIFHQVNKESIWSWSSTWGFSCYDENWFCFCKPFFYFHKSKTRININIVLRNTNKICFECPKRFDSQKTKIRETWIKKIVCNSVSAVCLRPLGTEYLESNWTWLTWSYISCYEEKVRAAGGMPSETILKL